MIALSGGVDSMVLLHAMHELVPRLQASVIAVHVNHGIAAQAGQWESFCKDACQRLSIEFTALTIDARRPNGKSPEAWARKLRYAAIRSEMMARDVVLTAHQQDDQAETLLLQLFRGAGPRGLAAMPDCRVFGPGWLGRPLLEFTREDILKYAAANELSWIEDQSNIDSRFDRNFIRRQLLPLIRQRWPACLRTLARAAELQGEALAVLDEAASRDLSSLVSAGEKGLSISGLARLDSIHQRNALRYWIRQAGLPAPSSFHVDEILSQVKTADADAQPCVRWEGAELHRYRDHLYVMPPLPVTDSREVKSWRVDQRLALSTGILYARRATGRGIKAALCAGVAFEVRFRRGGERCRPAGRAHSQSLKKLFQASGVPPWIRNRVPLIYLGGSLVAVPDHWICEPFQAREGESGLEPIWEASF